MTAIEVRLKAAPSLDLAQSFPDFSIWQNRKGLYKKLASIVISQISPLQKVADEYYFRGCNVQWKKLKTDKSLQP